MDHMVVCRIKEAIYKMNILTFDTEEWYNYAQMGGKGNFLPDVDKVQNDLLDKLNAHNIKATFFVLGVVARNYPYVVKNIIDRGHDIGCHSDIHSKLWQLNPKQLREDTRCAIDSIEQVSGKKVTEYRAPAFSIGKENKWALEILAENGITTDCSIFPGARAFGGFPEFTEARPCIIHYNGIQIMELPISLRPVFGKQLAYTGGGYFRMIPYSFIKKWVSESEYNMMYMHVHDFNGNQKRVLQARYIQSYYGNKTSMNKLEKLLSDFDFINVKEAVEKIDWSNVQKIKL